MADSIYTFDPVAENNTALDTIPYGPNQLYHSQIDNWFRALAAKLAQHVDDMGGVNTVGGTANAITATIASGVTAYANGLLFWFKNTGGPNTTAATMNVNSIGAKEIRLQGDSALVGGEMLDNGYYGLLYDTAYDGGDGGWVLLNPEISTSISFATNAQALAATSTTLSVNPANLASLIQNINNNAFKIADLEGVRLNMAGGIADAYDSETDVDTATSTNEVYDATNDLYSPSTSTATTGTFGTANSSSAAVEAGNQSMGFQFTAPGTGTVTQVKIDVSAVGSGGTWEARLYTNNAGSPGTQVGSSGTGLSITTTGEKTLVFGTPPSITNATVYWIVITPTSGTPGMDVRTCANNASYGSGRNNTITSITNNLASSEDWRMEITYTTAPNNMTLVSNAFTATAVPTVARIAAFIDPQVSMTINTDFTAEASRDGGTTWTAITLALVSNPVGTVEQYEGSVSISSQPSGSSMKYRLKTLNNKDIDVTGTVFQWG